MRQFEWYSISKSRNILFGISAFWIMLFHSYLNFDFLFSNTYGKIAGSFLYSFINMGNCGVDIFLLLSGIGLYFSFSTNNNVLSFYKKRVERVLLPSFIISLIYNISKFVIFKTSIKKFIISCLFLEILVDGTRTFWYITLIIILYAIFPFLYKLFEKYKTKSFILSLAFAIIINVVMKSVASSYYDKIEILLTRIPIFLIGLYIAKFVKEKKKNSSIMIYVCALILISSCIFLFLYNYNIINCEKSLYRYSSSALAFSITILLSYLIPKINLKYIFRFFAWFGIYSLEFYLVFEKINMIVIENIPFDDSLNLTYTVVSFIISMIICIILKKTCGLLINIGDKLLSDTK